MAFWGVLGGEGCRNENCGEKGAKHVDGLQDRVMESEKRREEQQQVQPSLPAHQQTCLRAWEKTGGWWFEIKKRSCHPEVLIIILRTFLRTPLRP